jgi:hypothetical protein
LLVLPVLLLLVLPVLLLLLLAAAEDILGSSGIRDHRRGCERG